MDAFINALCTEIRIRKGEIEETIQTIYWGGGTPSRLHKDHFQKVFDTLSSEFVIDTHAEITLEANPDDLTPRYIHMLAGLPFNRISIGIQSFNDNQLTFLSRRHSAQQAIDAVRMCQENGFKNISIDLMYGLPGQTQEIWDNNLQRAIKLNIQHISAYHLIYEDKTRMYSLLQTGKIHPVNEDLSTHMFSELIDTLTNAGFIHYEISNFGKPNYFARHNSAYWDGQLYMGVGPSAHSFNGDTRSWNISSLSEYLKGIQTEKLLRKTEYLTINEKYNEFILTGLRTMWGVNLEKLKNSFGLEYYDFCMENAQKYLSLHLLKIKNSALMLTRKGIFISDGVMSELMKID